MLASVAFNYAIGGAIGRRRGPGARASAGSRSPSPATSRALAVFKYANFAVANVNALAPVLGITPIALGADPAAARHLVLHVPRDLVRRRRLQAQRATPSAACRDFALYILLFPQLIAGPDHPLARHRRAARRAREQRLADFAYGVRRFVLGLGKKVLIANTLGRVADQIFALPATELTTPLAWLGLVCYTLQIYFDFSGYSDMAIGLMRMFGFRILENFNYPYIARSDPRVLAALAHLAVELVPRLPLHPARRQPARRARARTRNLVIVFLLCGLWHGASWTFVLWGAWHGAFLVAERAGLDRRAGAHRRRSRTRYALLAVMGGWVLFRCETLAHGGDYYAALAGLGAGRSAAPSARRVPRSARADRAVPSASSFATPLARRLGAGAIASRAAAGRRRRASCSPPTSRGSSLVLFVAGAFLAAGTYNPFIYFRF